jgi:hypothetical protein
MRSRRTLAKAALVFVGAGACVTGLSMPAWATTVANGKIATTEYYSSGSQNPTEVVVVQASNWGSQKSVAFEITNRSTHKNVEPGTVYLQYGAGTSTVVGLNCGKYALTYKHIDGASSTVDFAVTDDGKC